MLNSCSRPISKILFFREKERAFACEFCPNLQQYVLKPLKEVEHDAIATPNMYKAKDALITLEAFEFGCLYYQLAMGPEVKSHRSYIKAKPYKIT